MWSSIDQIKRAHRELPIGNHWFDEDAMRFFGTRIVSGVLHGRYFITSEQPPRGPRMFSIREVSDDAVISTVGKFCEYKTSAQAEKALERLLSHAA